MTDNANSMHEKETSTLIYHELQKQGSHKKKKRMKRKGWQFVFKVVNFTWIGLKLNWILNQINTAFALHLALRGFACNAGKWGQEFKRQSNAIEMINFFLILT